MANFEIRKATRTGIKPLVGLYGESGTGKTMSALLLARGFVGPEGRIGMIDTESGRGSLYADVIPGGYEVLELRDPFSPIRHIEAMEALEKSGVGIGLIDSGSMEWEGISGVLDMATEIEEKSGKPGLHCWKVPKMQHNLWLRKLLQSPLPWIICLRAKYKSRQGKNDAGKTVIIKDDRTSPIQAEDFIFECTAHAEILQDHSILLTKCSHPALRQCFPSKGPITIEHGKLLAQWCLAGTNLAGGGAITPAGSSLSPAGPPQPSPASPTDSKAKWEHVRKRWIAACISAGGGKPDYAIEFAVEAGILLDTEGLEDWPTNKIPLQKAESSKIILPRFPVDQSYSHTIVSLNRGGGDSSTEESRSMVDTKKH